MKVITSSLCLLLLSHTLCGQTNMVIHKTSGEKDTVAISLIEKITFFTTDTNTIADIDGNIYHMIKIGNQIWTVENLRTTRYNDGTSISKLTKDGNWTTTTLGAYCAYNNNESNAGTYGYLYNWYAVNSGKLAPEGWRVPSDEDWTELIDYVGGEGVAGFLLKSTSGWNSDGNGTDDFKFKALPGGSRHFFTGTFSDMGNYGFWWSSTPYGGSESWYRQMYYNQENVNRFYYFHLYGFSIRLVRDL